MQPDLRSPVDIEDLLRESDADHEAADRLLDDLQLLDQWGAYGAVEVGGSYGSDLMLASDIDLFVENPHIDLDLALDAFQRFVQRGEFLRFALIDSVRGMPPWADAETFPRGYMVGMAGDFSGREWKVETWLLASPP